MEKREIVTDASVVAKWFLDEEFSEKARFIRDSLILQKLTISVPSLLFYETLNALRYTHLYDASELASVARSLSKYGFNIHEPRGRLYEETARTSQKYNISIYDAAYLALASYLHTTLYTADLELVQKAPRHVKHIRQLPTCD